ncbi:MAG: efflux RND transporter periplasmic adaptor subunit [Comamonadaceae bacterium]|nr:MAG: efflux RND transporter periplasmic adaptor subunit [Comamonadaceae bacterium]
MASKAIYTAVAVAGIAVASGAAWWIQRPKALAAGDGAAVTTAPVAAATTSASAPKTAVPTVEAARVEVARLSDETQAVGSLRSRRGVVLRPEVSGRITQLNFTDGQRVRKGQVLVQFDDQLPRAQVQQSQAELSIAQANQKRNQELVAQNFVSQRSLDESAANLQVAQAKLSLSQATAQRLQIVAPFDGIAGIRLVNVGDYLKDGSDIVNIEDIEAIYVDFRLPERFQSKIKRGQMATLDIDAMPGRKYPAQILAIDPLIDANGRSVGVRGCIDNRQLQLRPGMFARVNTVFATRDNARVVPEEAIVPQGGRHFVVRLVDAPDGKSKASQRVEVKVGLRSPGRVEILQGLDVGDLVVRAGQQRVQKDGTVVKVLDMAAAGGAGNPAAPPAAASPSVQAAPAKVEAASAGRNPCGVITAEVGTKPVAVPAASPAHPAPRDSVAPRNPA